MAKKWIPYTDEWGQETGGGYWAEGEEVEATDEWGQPTGNTVFQPKLNYDDKDPDNEWGTATPVTYDEPAPGENLANVLVNPPPTPKLPTQPPPPEPTPIPLPSITPTPQQELDKLIAEQPIDPAIKQEAKIEELQGQQTAEQQRKSLEDFITNLGTKANEEKMARQKQFSELIGKQKTAGEGYLNEFKSGRKQRMGDLANLLSQTTERQMSEYTPAMLEDLSSRGLLHSSAVGENLARKRKELAGSTAEKLQAQNLADLDAEQGLSGNILANTQALEKAGLKGDVDLGNWGLDTSKGLGTTGYQNQFELAKQILGQQAGLRTAGIERNYSLFDQSNADALARELGNIESKASTQNAYTGLAGNLLGAGVSGLFNNWDKIFKQQKSKDPRIISTNV